MGLARAPEPEGAHVAGAGQVLAAEDLYSAFLVKTIAHATDLFKRSAAGFDEVFVA